MTNEHEETIVRRESRAERRVEQGRIRVYCVAACFLFSFLAISVELIQITLLNQDATTSEALVTPLQSNAGGEINTSLEIPRGDIVDRNGTVIATTLATESLFANPHDLISAKDATRKIVKIFPELDEKDVYKKLSKNCSFVWIKRNLTPKEQYAANNLGLPGLYFQQEHKRIYPEGSLLSHVTGFVGLDNTGLSGVEKYFDKQLRDTKQNRQPLKLSIDLRLQHIVAEEIKAGMDNFNAIGATGVVLEIGSGEIMAMANLPDYDPHNPRNPNDMAMFNRATLGSYEMGSTFKTFTTAMALDYGVANLNDGYDASHPIQFANYTIKDEHAKNRWLTIPEIYTYSSNIGTVRMVMDVGKERQQRFLRKLGLMDPVNIELPEIGTSHYPKNWTELSSMTISYGHGMAVTPLHLVRAFGTIVNGGYKEDLTLIKDGNRDKPKGEPIISEKTSLQMRRLMRMVVEHGTGKKANVDGYRVGGKTGTAEKVNASGGYSRKANMALFISAFPVDDPKYIVLVMIDEPKGNKSSYGFATAGWVAAPVVGNIISRMAPMYGLQPVFDVPEDPVNQYWVNNANQRFLNAVSY